MLETQDNNLIACKFYHNCGFKIGSVDTMLYANFENNFEKAVFWFLWFLNARNSELEFVLL